MKQTVSLNDFRDAFRAYDRLDNFSYDGLGALFEYLEELEEDTGEEMELDVIAICCDFSEYDSAVDCITGNGYDLGCITNIKDDDEKEDAALEYLRDNTTVITFDGGIIIQDF